MKLPWRNRKALRDQLDRNNASPLNIRIANLDITTNDASGDDASGDASFNITPHIKLEQSPPNPKPAPKKPLIEGFYANAGQYGEPVAPNKVCTVHAAHRPHVSMPDVHHIWPKGWGGPDIPSNTVVVCPTGHRNVHELLNAWVRSQGRPPIEIERHYALSERRLAEAGWTAAHQQPGPAPTPTPTPDPTPSKPTPSKPTPKSKSKPKTKGR
jgi:hypothetical protein